MIYVDDAFISHKGRTWCHLMADTDRELEAFARRIGLPVSWKHGDHYDLTAEKKAHAVKNGARKITAREMVEIRRRLRRAGKGAVTK